MKSMTKQKPIEEIQQSLEGLDKVFVVGCGTCTTLTNTGGVEQVDEMKEKLQEMGKWLTGTVVIPTACDDMTDVAMKENEQAIRSADCLLSMSCALGIHGRNYRNIEIEAHAVDTQGTAHRQKTIGAADSLLIFFHGNIGHIIAGGGHYHRTGQPFPHLLKCLLHFLNLLDASSAC